MSKRSVSLMAMLLLTTACTEICDKSLLIKRDNNLYYRTDSNAPYTGIAREKHKNGRLAKEETYRDGKKHGLDKRWRRDGSLSETRTFSEGISHGMYRCWHPDGRLSLKLIFENNKIHGIKRRWNKGGELVLEKYFEHGICIPKKVFTMLNNQIVFSGILTEKYANGALKNAWIIKDSKLNGICKDWYDNSQKKLVHEFNNSVRTGPYELWYRDGQIKQRKFYKDGLLHGTCIDWDQGGAITSQKEYVNGVKVKNEITTEQ